MEKKYSCMASAKTYQAEFTPEFKLEIEKSTLFFINKLDPFQKVSPVERNLIVEDTLYHVYKNITKYDPTKDAKLITWAIRVAHNFVIDKFRKIWYGFYPVRMIPKPGGTDEESFLDFDSYGSEPDCSSQLYSKEIINNFLPTLAKSERIVVEKTMDGFTKREIMAQTGMSSGYFDVCLCRAREKLRAYLRKSGYKLSA